MDVTRFSARDGETLAYRTVAGDAPRAVVIFLHGGSHSGLRYAPLAREAARRGCVAVLPDLRGHGESGGARGHVPRVGILEDDLLDLVKHVQERWPGLPLILGGHSSGSQVVLRYALKPGVPRPKGWIIVAPTIPTASEVSRYDQDIGVWRHRLTHWRAKTDARPLPDAAARVMPRLKLPLFLAAQMLPPLRKRPVLEFPDPAKTAHLEKRTLAYTFNMMANVMVKQYGRALASLDAPLLVMIGANDEATDPRALETLLAWETPAWLEKTLHVLPGRGHMDVIGAGAKPFGDWLEGLL